MMRRRLSTCICRSGDLQSVTDRPKHLFGRTYVVGDRTCLLSWPNMTSVETSWLQALYLDP